MQIGNAHRIGKPTLGRIQPIVVRFLYRKDDGIILKKAYRLKRKPFGINEQFPMEIHKKKKKLYPILKKIYKHEGMQVQLVLDNL